MSKFHPHMSHRTEDSLLSDFPPDLLLFRESVMPFVCFSLIMFFPELPIVGGTGGKSVLSRIAPPSLQGEGKFSLRALSFVLLRVELS